MSRQVTYGLFLAFLGLLAIAWFRPPAVTVPDKEVKEAGTFEECVAEGNKIEESYPPTCRTKSGRILTQNIGNEQVLRDVIKIDSPRPTTKVTSPLKITGEARGPWFFEAQFSASLIDENGQILGTGIMTADGEWMTEDFVPYSGEITFTPPVGDQGKLVLEKNNPSGISEKDSQLIVPVKFR